MAGPPDRLPDPDRQPRRPQPACPAGARGGRPRRLRGHPPRRAPATSGSSSPGPRLVSNHESNEVERARQLVAADRARGAGGADLRRRDAGDLRSRLPADPRLHRARPRGRGAARAVGGDHGPGRLRAAGRPLALRGLPAAPRRRARAGAALARDRGRVRVAAPAARLAGGAGGARPGPPGRRLPRADQAARGGRPRARSASSPARFRDEVKGEIVRRDRARVGARRRRRRRPSRSTPCAAWSSPAPARAPPPAWSRRSPEPAPTTSTGGSPGASLGSEERVNPARRVRADAASD